MPSDAPVTLGEAGAALWEAVTADYALSAPEEAVLAEACATLDTLSKLAEELASSALMVEGSKGQEVLHPAVREARQQRLALGRLLGQLDLPDEEGEALVESLTTVRARKAAQARWANGA